MPGESAAAAIAAGFGAEPGQFALATIHRPENTDDGERLGIILAELSKIGLPVLLPLHPRTRLAVQRHGLSADLDRLQAIPPVDHRTFLGLARQARLIVSDSGGVQEECTVLKRPLIVVRNSTERPEALLPASLTCCSQAPRSASFAASACRRRRARRPPGPAALSVRRRPGQRAHRRLCPALHRLTRTSSGRAGARALRLRAAGSPFRASSRQPGQPRPAGTRSVAGLAVALSRRSRRPGGSPVTGGPAAWRPAAGLLTAAAGRL